MIYGEIMKVYYANPLKNIVSVVNFLRFACVFQEKVVYLHPTKCKVFKHE